MIKYILTLLLFISLVSCCEKNNQTTLNKSYNDTIYNEDLAKKIGADDYGMKKYVIAFLKRGPNRSKDSIKSANLQRAHLNSITKLAKEGKLVLAGPFLGDGVLRGIYVFNVETIEEAEKLTNSDPAIQAGSLTMELKEWYGSAALMLINDLHKKIAKTKI